MSPESLCPDCQVNSNDYGLGSSVFSLNYCRAERLAAGIRAGMCNINDFGINYLCQSLPFGGVKVPRSCAEALTADLWL